MSTDETGESEAESSTASPSRSAEGSPSIDGPTDAASPSPPQWTRTLSRALIVVGGALGLAIGLARNFGWASGTVADVVVVLSLLVAAGGAVLRTVLPKPELTEALMLVVGVFVLAGLISGVLYIERPGPTPPDPMTGEFKIAVSEFVGTGTDDDERAATSISDSLFVFLDAEARQWQELTDDDVRVRAPSAVGKIEGANEQERAEAASTLAEAIDADLVIYGTLTSDRGVTTLSPSFFLAADRLDGAQELLGDYELGAPVVAAGGPEDARQAIRQEMQARTRSFARYVLGLVQYRTGDFDEAVQYFQQARDELTPTGDVAWAAEDGRELIHLFLANALGMSGLLDEAEDEYGVALSLSDMELARAWVGLAEIARVRSGCVGAGTGTADLLDEADTRYQRAIQAEVQPTLSYVGAKSAIGTAKVSFCRSDFDAAVTDFEAAILLLDTPAAGAGRTDRSASDLLGEAHLGLGITFVQRAGGADADLEAAIPHFEQAVEHHQDLPRRALAHAWLGWLHQRLGHDSELTVTNCDMAADLGLSEPTLGDLCPG